MGKNYEKALASKSFFSHLFSQCFSLQVQAHSQASTLSLCIFLLFLSHHIHLPIVPFCLTKKKDDIYPLAKGQAL